MFAIFGRRISPTLYDIQTVFLPKRLRAGVWLEKKELIIKIFSNVARAAGALFVILGMIEIAGVWKIP